MSRSRSAKEKWTRIIREQQASGLSIAAFCAERSVAESSFYPWKRRLRSAAGASDGAGFVEATVRDIPPPPDAAGGVRIEVGAGGRRVIVARGFDRRLLLDVIETLESTARGAAGGGDA